MAARPLRSMAAPPLDSDDLLSEILLRLPPQPSSLPRASAVCKSWRRLISSPAFLRRFRIHHRRNPPLLGVFLDGSSHYSFRPTLEAPNSISPERFSLQPDDGFRRLGCRHGLVLMLNTSPRMIQVLVWDPVTGDQHRIALPPTFVPAPVHGAVLRAAAGDGRQYFQVVLVAEDVDDIGALAWGDVISITLPDISFFITEPAVLIGKSLFFSMLTQSSYAILEFDLERQGLALIQAPPTVDMWRSCNFRVMPAQGGGLGFLYVSGPGFSMQLWKRVVTDCGGVASWRLERTVEMDRLLPLCKEKKGLLAILGFAEDNNVVFMWTTTGIFMLQLDSLEFKKVFNACSFCHLHPFESVYTTGMGIGGGHGAELLHSA